MNRLHLLLSPSAAAVRDCIGQCVTGDYILLVDGGVTLLANDGLLRRLREEGHATIGVGAADARARGLQSAAKRAGLAWIDDSDWAALVADYPVVLSWK